MSIKNKLFIWIGLIMIVSVTVLAYFSIPQIERIVFDRTTRVMTAETNAVVRSLEAWFFERGSILKSTAAQIEYQRYKSDDPELAYLLKGIAGRYPHELAYLYAGFADKRLVSTRETPPPQGFDPTKRPWYTSAIRAGGLVVTEPYADIQTGRFSLSLAYPLNTPVPGVIATDLYSYDLRNLANKAVFHPEARVVLVSQAGRLLYATDESLGVWGESLAEVQNGVFKPVINHLTAGVPENFKITIGDAGYYVLCAPVPSAGWTVAIYLPEALFLEEQRKFIVFFAGILLVSLLGAFAAAYFIIGRITKPLGAIAQTAKKLGEGDLEATFTGSGSLEVMRLAASLDRMRVKLLALLQEKDSLLEETLAQNEEIEALYEQTKALYQDLEKACEDKAVAYMDTIKALSDAIEAKDCYTRGHSERVLRYSELIGTALGWDEAALATLRYAAILHDIGKIGVSQEILNKPGRLTAEEFELVKAHAETGYRILRSITHLSEVRRIVREHHERIDGSGYPRGLTGPEISPAAKVLAVADAFDAMTTERPYRPAMSTEEACAELRRYAGSQFDAEIVAVFCEKVVPLVA
ncbi:MAG: HD domain-containing protein [Negativicutes bacterium]|nr:HD domain-containing protein [Negativicutes bacterium]